MRNKRITGQERLGHVIEAISVIEEFLEGHSKETFLNSAVTINAVLFQFAIIGEAITHVDDKILSKYNYPWREVRSFRNFILHEYPAIEYWIVWDTAESDLPKLKQTVTTILKNEFNFET